MSKVMKLSNAISIQEVAGISPARDPRSFWKEGKKQINHPSAIIANLGTLDVYAAIPS